MLRSLPLIKLFNSPPAWFWNPRWRRFWLAIKWVLIITITIVLGVVLGTLLVSPAQELAISGVSNLAFVVLTLANPLYGLVLAIMTDPITGHFTIIDMGHGLPNFSAFRLIFGLTFVLFFLRVATGQWRLRSPNLALNVTALFFLMGYIISFGNHHWTTTQSLQFLADMWILPIITYTVISNLTMNRRQVHVILNVLLILGIFSALYMMYEQSTGHILFEVKDTSKNFYKDSTLRIVRGLYGTTTIFGNVLNLLIPIDLYFFLKARTSGKKMYYLLGFVIMVIGILLTYKRAVWLGLVFSFMLIQWFYPQFRKFFFLILFVATIGMAATWNSISQSELVTTRVTGTDDWQDANGRTERWDAGLEYWRRNPIFGSGFRAYETGPYQQVENLYIHILASGGLVTFIPMIGMFLVIIKDSIRVFIQARDNPRLFVNRDLISVFWGGGLAYLFMAYFGSGIEGRPVSNMLFFTICATIVGSQVAFLGRSDKAAETKLEASSSVIAS